MGLFKNKFQERMFKESEDVYGRITRGEIQGPEQVEAALLDAHLRASTEGEGEAGHGDA